MLGKRIFTAVVGIPIAAYIIIFGQWVFGSAILLLSIAGWYELSNMLQKRNIHSSFTLGILAILLLEGCAWLGNSDEYITVLVFINLFTFVKTVIFCGSFSLNDAVFTLFGINYIGLLFSHLLLLRFTDDSLLIKTAIGSISAGAAYVWLAFIGTWASDTFAFFVGSRFGKHKLCPAVSPGKTREGFAGGLAGSILGVVAAAWFFHFSLSTGLIVGILVGIIGPCGDLVESSIKRFCGVKDSGRLLPGHGGVLDRFDSILFAIPVVYYYIHFWGSR